MSRIIITPPQDGKINGFVDCVSQGNGMAIMPLLSVMTPPRCHVWFFVNDRHSHGPSKIQFPSESNLCFAFQDETRAKLHLLIVFSDSRGRTVRAFRSMDFGASSQLEGVPHRSIVLREEDPDCYGTSLVLSGVVKADDETTRVTRLNLGPFTYRLPGSKTRLLARPDLPHLSVRETSIRC